MVPRNAPLSRRRLLGWAAGLGVGTAAAQPTPAWPNRPVRFVVAFPPGGLADVLMRVLAAPLSSALGQPVIVDNRSGASGNLAAVEAARNGGDGHTFLVNTSTLETVNPLMFDRMPLDPAHELKHVALLANTQLFLVTRPTLAVQTMAEFVAYARANPGRLSYGSAGNGTTPHVGGELLKQSAGFFATHIPYRGAAPVIQDVMAGQIDYALVPGTVFGSVRSGRMKLLSVASRQRASYQPSVPTIEETGFGKVYVDTLFVVYAPAAMPAANVARINTEINRLLQATGMRPRFAEVGAEPMPMAPTEVAAVVRDEAALFGPIVKSKGIRAD